jgi:hypothetical protein
MPIARATSMTAEQDLSNPISKFFASLNEPGQLATFAGESATLRFDVLEKPAAKDVERWHVSVQQGEVAVSRRKAAADAIVAIARPQFEAMVTGRLNAQAALLRGLLTCKGSMSALMIFQRCLPGPPGSTGRVAPISGNTVMAQRRAT